MSQAGQMTNQSGLSCNGDRDTSRAQETPTGLCPGVPGDTPGRDKTEAGRDIESRDVGGGDPLSGSPATDEAEQKSAPAGGPASHGGFDTDRRRLAADPRFAAWAAGSR